MLLSSQIQNTQDWVIHINTQADAQFTERWHERYRWRQTTEDLGINQRQLDLSYGHKGTNDRFEGSRIIKFALWLDHSEAI